MTISKVLLRHNLHTIQFTHSKRAIQCYFSIFTDMCKHHNSQLQNIFIISKENPVLCNYNLFIPPIPRPIPKQSLVYFPSPHTFFCSGYFIWTPSHNMQYFVTGYFYLIYILKNHWSYIMYQYFIILCLNIMLNGYAICCLSIPQLMDLWIVSTFWLYE